MKSPVLGLDLKGGLEVVLKAVPSDPKNPPTDAQIDQAISIIRSRVDKLGVSEPEIRKEAGSEVSIALAGIKDPRAAASIIGSTGQLYMLDYTGSLEPIVSRSATGTASYRGDALRAAQRGQEPARYAPLRRRHGCAVVRVRHARPTDACSTPSGSRSRPAPRRRS